MALFLSANIHQGDDLFSICSRGKQCSLSQNSLVEHTKRFSQVIVSSSQKQDHIVYLPSLLIMQMMLKWIKDPQYMMWLIHLKQSVPILANGISKNLNKLTSISYDHITNVNSWDLALLNNILCDGNNLYSSLSNSIYKRYLLLTDVPEMVSVFDNPPTISWIY